MRFGLSALPAFRAASCLGWCIEEIRADFFLDSVALCHLAGAPAGHSFSKTRVCDLLGGAEARQTARALADPPHARRTAEMSSPASRPDRPEGAAETRRGDDASEGHAAPSASSEGSNVAEGSSSAREGLPSAGTSTTGQDATGAEARDESPDVSSRVTSGAGKDAADAPHAPHAPSTVRPARPPQRPPSELRPRRGAASAPDARLRSARVQRRGGGHRVAREDLPGGARRPDRGGGRERPARRRQRGGSREPRGGGAKDGPRSPAQRGRGAVRRAAGRRDGRGRDAAHGG